MFKDLRFAFRMIVSRPWFSATVMLTLALGIGVNTTVFTLSNAALLKPVPLPHGDRLVVVEATDARDPKAHNGISFPELLDLRSQTPSLAGLEATEQDQAVISDKNTPPERYDMAYVTPGLFDLLGVSPVLGRGFSAADGVRGAPRVVILGNAVWQKQYSGDPGILGKVVRINGEDATVVGVMIPSFRFPSTHDLWMPLQPTTQRNQRSSRGLTLFGRLGPQSSMASVQAELDVESARLAKEFPDTNKDWLSTVLTFQDAFNGGPVKHILLLMLGAAGFVLLIACANVANMMLSRAQSRGREIAIRAAIGASRWHILRQLLVESVLLSVIGGSVGLLFALWGVHAFDLATQDVGKPYWVLFNMDWRVFAYFAAVCVGTGLLFGTVPAWRASRTDVNAALKDGASSGTVRAGWFAGALVVLQYALTVMLLVGAGIMMKSFLEAEHINPFVPAEHLLVAQVSLPDGKGERYEGVEARRRMHDALLERLAAVPGVTQAALASNMPGRGSQQRDIEVEGRPNADPKHAPKAAAVFATPNYLSVIGLPLLAGRGFNATDGLEGREAAIVTRAFAARYWPDENPIGKRFRFITDGKPQAWETVIGMCGDVVQDTMSPNPPPLAYFSDRQEPWAWLGLLLRSNGDPAALTASVRKAVQQVDPDLPLFEARTLPAAINHDHWFLQVFGSLFLFFAATGLLMASVGVYAVVAQATHRRTREIGIRMALGASAAGVVRLVLSRGVRQMAGGLAIGLTGAVAATRVMDGIPGLSTSGSLPIVALVGILLACIGTFACWLPARRAALVTPTEALRAD